MAFRVAALILGWELNRLDLVPACKSKCSRRLKISLYSQTHTNCHASVLLSYKHNSFNINIRIMTSCFFWHESEFYIFSYGYATKNIWEGVGGLHNNGYPELHLNINSRYLFYFLFLYFLWISVAVFLSLLCIILTRF